MIPNTYWPMILDMPREECRKILRRLELEAYSNIVSAFRAQGVLSKDKRKVLQDLASILHISVERHKAEIRRAVNDEKLATVAEHMAGPNTNTEWAIEGRRLIPLVPRIVPQTVYTPLANKMADLSAVENAKLPPPVRTVKQKGTSVEVIDISATRDDNSQDVIICDPQLPSSPSASSSVPATSSAPRKKPAAPTPKLIPPPPPPPPPLPLKPPPPPLRKVGAKEVPQKRHRGKRRRLSSGGDRPLGPVELAHLHKMRLSPTFSVLHAGDLAQHAQEIDQSIHQEQRQHRPHRRTPQPSTHQEQPLQQLQQKPPPPPPPQPPPPPLLKHKFSSAALQFEGEKERDLIQLPLIQQSQKMMPPPKLVQFKKPQHPARLPPPLSSLPKLQEASSSTVTGPHFPSASHPRLVSSLPSNAPMKITLGRCPQGNIGTNTTTTITTATSAPATQKVIIVQSSGSGGGPGQPSILQRSLSVPVMKSSPAATVSRAPLIISGAGNTPPVTPTTIVTISTNPAHSSNLTATTVSIGGVPTAAYITSPGNIPRMRPKTMQLPSRMRPRAGSIVIPMTPNLQAGPSGFPGVTLKTTPIQASRPGMHLKPEGGMKIMPVPGGPCGSAKIIPKPCYGSGAQPPMYMMNPNTSSITMVTRTIPAACPPSLSRLMTMTATTLPHTITSSQALPVTSTLGPKPCTVVRPGSCVGTGHLMGPPVGNKPNVIVVQKAPGCGIARGVRFPGSRMHSMPTSFQGVLNKVAAGKGMHPSAATCTTSTTVPQFTHHGFPRAPHPGLRIPPGSEHTFQQASNVLVLDVSHESLSKNMMIADILQASGIATDPDTFLGQDKEGEMEHFVSISGTTQDASNDSGLSTLQLSRHKSSALHISQGGEMMEVTGELDPQTGVYSLHAEVPADIVTKGSSHTLVPDPSTRSTDIFSSALASADISLDSFQYVEEGMDSLPETAQPSSSIEVTIGGGTDQIGEEQLQFLQGGTGSSEPVAVTVEPSHIDTTGMHIEDYTSQKLQGQDTMD